MDFNSNNIFKFGFCPCIKCMQGSRINAQATNYGMVLASIRYSSYSSL